SGQVYEPDGAGAWRRLAEGGVAGDVAGATLADGHLVVAGRAAPLYRRDHAIWYALRVGGSGRTRLGTGPAPAVAVGKAVHVDVGGTWKRVGALPDNATALWAQSATAVWAATDDGLYKLRGKRFERAGAAPTALAGDRPYAIDADAIRDLTRGRTIPLRLDGEPVTATAAASHGGGALHVVVATGAGALVLARVDGKQLARVDDLPVAGAPVAMAVDADGDVLIALADGTIALRRGDAWTTTAVTDALPAPPAGSPPARTR
ncbi:MAG: hypothetical protein KC464_09305, partial [Myxococcales bacterium]|nr:hypothetical protein [Myxococcales bacterium]